jgi:hypothetical protein
LSEKEDGQRGLGRALIGRQLRADRWDVVIMRIGLHRRATPSASSTRTVTPSVVCGQVRDLWEQRNQGEHDRLRSASDGQQYYGSEQRDSPSKHHGSRPLVGLTPAACTLMHVAS